MIDLSSKLEGYENYVTQDLNGDVFKWEYKPIIDEDDYEWISGKGESTINSWMITGIKKTRNTNWKESLVDLSTHAPYLINGVLTAVPRLNGVIPEKKEDNWGIHTVEAPLTATEIRLREQEMDKYIADIVNKPEHYRQGDIECIDALKSATTYKLGIAAVCVANVIKYLWRYESKNGLEDVKKAQWYLNRLVMEMEENGND